MDFGQTKHNRFWVYVIGAMTSDYEAEAFKIGLTEKPATRIRELQTGNHRSLELLSYETFPTRDEASRFESAAHMTFGMFRLSGEWFRAVPVIEGWARSLFGEYHFRINDLDRNCWSSHGLDDDGNCLSSCDYEAQEWRIAQ